MDRDVVGRVRGGRSWAGPRVRVRWGRRAVLPGCFECVS